MSHEKRIHELEKTNKMKRTNLLLIALACVLIACQKEPTLPQETQSGEDTFGMLLDGRVWTPNPKFLGGGYAKATLYDYESVDRVNFTKLEIFSCNTEFNEKVRFAIDSIEGIGWYSPVYFASPYFNKDTIIINNDTIETSNKFEIFTGFCGFNTLYKLKHPHKSIVHITHLDTSKREVSGTFELELENNEGQKVSISEGRFDLVYRHTMVDSLTYSLVNNINNQ